MALQKKTIRLLILEDSQNEAERLVSLFRNAGQATRVHRLTSSDDLAEALKQIWDLLISAPQSENLDPSEAISAIRRQAKDIPIIQLTATGDNMSGMRKATRKNLRARICAFSKIARPKAIAYSGMMARIYQTMFLSAFQ